MPDGRCDLILRFSSDGHSVLGGITPVIAGPATRFHIILLRGGTAFVGIRLRPALAPIVLGRTLAPIVDRAFVGSEALALMPALSKLCMPAASVVHMSERLDSFVAERFSEDRLDRLALALIDTIHLTGGRLSVEDVARLHAIHPKTVRRHMLAATGLSPKQYASIIRFHRALRLRRDAGLDPAAAAFEAGFADQPHMSRVIRHMGGISAAKPVRAVLAGLPI